MRSLSTKLMLAFLAISLTGAAFATVIARWITIQEFERLVMEQSQNNFMTEVTTYYQTYGSWIGVTDYFRAKRESQQPLVGSGNPAPPAEPREPGKPPPVQSREPVRTQPQPPPQNQLPSVPIILIDQNGYVIHPVPPYRLGDYIPPEKLAQGTPVRINGQVVGTILATGAPPPLDAREQEYLDRTNQAILVSALGAMALALGLSVVLARTLTQPLRELTGAIRKMAQGKLGVAVPVRSRDEIGELTTAFNQMSADLARSNQLRRQMTADIAHDLRTPLTVIGGYIESLREGVLEPNSTRFDVMHEQVQQLQHLVEDLRTLSLADAGELKLNRQHIAPLTLLEQTASAFKRQAEQKHIALELKTEPGLPDLVVDEIRIAQVLGNLASNALRYTPDRGRIALSAHRQAQQIVLSVKDNGAGIAPDALPHVFERFYRADVSRQTESESGLGLAIAKSLVEAHGGTITATSEGVGKGSTFSVCLPE
jgi:two-component system, OmpR family, sensor histidine kinase BaeS